MASFGKKISTKFKNRYRLIVRKDENLEEKVSLVLTPLNTLLVISALIVLFGTVVVLMLSYTPMSRILPTTANNFSQQERLELISKIQELERWKERVDLQEQSLRAILAQEEGVELVEVPAEEEGIAPQVQVVQSAFTPNPINYTFYQPLKGVVSDTFNRDRKHYAVDIAAKTNEVVKAAQHGTVIYSAWNPESGYTMVLQHANDFLSVYKHNATLLKKEGTFVNAGDAIALVGNTGELSSGPHLHFELWNNGVPLDPLKYISF
jgi:murein DD-endopeptidase MepM/ murein hydrolase activator NlpD